jgi:hypothetical protein
MKSLVSSVVILTAFWASPAAQRAPAESRTSVRSINFRNFHYPWDRQLGDPSQNFILSEGNLAPTRDAEGFVDEMGASLVGVGYGDLTGDGGEEAMVAVSFTTGGSAIPHCVYIFTVDEGEARKLWSVVTGDRAHGGLKDAYAEDGKLIIERFWARRDAAACCPKAYKRTAYRWSGGRFVAAKRSGPHGMEQSDDGQSNKRLHRSRITRPLAGVWRAAR